jgi:endoglucanase
MSSINGLSRAAALLVLLILTLPLPLAAAGRDYSFHRGVNISHWLSQNSPAQPYAAPWFGKEDIAWIAAQGFDHIRYPIDGREWLRADGTLDEAKIAPFVRALAWTKAQGLGAILDMHFLPGASFDPGDQQASVFTDDGLQAKVADFWARAARRFAGEGDYLRFEVLNEPVAEKNEQLNPFNRRMLAAIRESNPTRIVYLTCNRWSAFTTVADMEVPADPHVAITVHYYEPMLFTHQRASWARFPADMPAIRFPGPVPDLTGFVPTDHHAFKPPGYELTVKDVDDAFDKVAAWAAKHAPGKEIYLGEFGVYLPADADSKRNYIGAIMNDTKRLGWSWAIWDYRDSFGVRDARGNGTPILEGLFPPTK